PVFSIYTQIKTCNIATGNTDPAYKLYRLKAPSRIRREQIQPVLKKPDPPTTRRAKQMENDDKLPSEKASACPGAEQMTMQGLVQACSFLHFAAVCPVARFLSPPGKNHNNSVCATGFFLRNPPQPRTRQEPALGFGASADKSHGYPHSFFR